MKNYVLARTTPLTRARKTLPSFDQAFEKLLANIEAFDVGRRALRRDPALALMSPRRRSSHGSTRRRR